jgi:SAM-dependent methyltransferase
MSESKYDKRYGALQRDEGFYSKLVHGLRTKKLLKLLKPGKNDRILDLGCNEGEYLREVLRYSKNCHGIDINKAMIRQAKKKKIMNVSCMSATNLKKFKDSSFDKIYSSHVLEHIPDVKKVFAEAYRVLRPNGIFIIIFPFELIRGQRAWKDAVRLGKGLSYAKQLHVHKLSPAKIRKIIKGIPFKTCSTGMMLGPLPDYVMVLEKKS